MSIGQFLLFSEQASALEAQRRLEFIGDVGVMFGKEDEQKKHHAALKKMAHVRQPRT